jgi:hypothetical protein
MPLQIGVRATDVTGRMSVKLRDPRLQLSLNKTLVEKDLCIEMINLVELYAEGNQSGTRVLFAFANSLQAPLPRSAVRVLLLLLLPSATRRIEVQRCAYTPYEHARNIAGMSGVHGVLPSAHRVKSA